jgi:flagellar hook-associated protein 1 FlgK
VTYAGAFAQLVSQVGSQTNQLQITSQAQTNMVNQTTQAQQSISGVNLDEEAANLMKYQQAYQAAGKAIQTANTLFSTLLTMLN